MMRTLTHEPLALAGVLILGLIAAVLLIVGAALWIRSMVLRRKDRATALAVLTPDDPSLPADQVEDEPDHPLIVDYKRWLDADMPKVWPQPAVVPGRSEP